MTDWDCNGVEYGKRVAFIRLYDVWNTQIWPCWDMGYCLALSSSGHAGASIKILTYIGRQYANPRKINK